MKKDPERGVFVAKRMVPLSQEVRYFFCDPSSGTVEFDRHHKTVSSELYEPIECVYVDGSVRHIQAPVKVNLMQIKKERRRVVDDNYNVMVDALPRDDGEDIPER